MPEEKRPDIRPQLREFLAWYEEVFDLKARMDAPHEAGHDELVFVSVLERVRSNWKRA